MDGRSTFGIVRLHVLDTPDAYAVGRTVEGLKNHHLKDPTPITTGSVSTGLTRRSMRYKVSPFVSPLAAPANGYIAGLVKEENVPIGGKLVRVHARDTGEVAGQAISKDDGYFKIEGLDRDTKNYYAVAFNDSPGKDFNAIVFDRVDPISDPAYDLDVASQNIMEQQPIAYWKNVMSFLKNGVYYDFGSLRQDVTLNSQNLPTPTNAWVDAPFTLRRMGRMLQQGCFLPIPDLLLDRMDNGWTIEIFVRFAQASNNENLFEAISEHSAGPSLTSHANTVRLGRVGTTNEVILQIYIGDILVAGGQSSSSNALAPGVSTVISMVYNGTTVKVYQKGQMLFSVTATIPNVGRQFTSICKNSMTGTSQFTGVLSEVAVFETALNPVQLQTHSDLL